MKFWRGNAIPVAVSAVVITTALALFFVDSARSLRGSGLTEIGTVTYRKKVAQRKLPGQVIWDEVEQHAPVYDGDSLRTEELSEAIVRLKDGTDIELDENSMILLASAREMINIDFAQGSILAKRDRATGSVLKDVTITSSGVRLSLGESEVSLARPSSAELSVVVTKGNVRIGSGEGEARVVAVDQRAVILSDSRDIKVSPLDVALQNPAPGSYLITKDELLAVDFSWKIPRQKEDAYLEISKDASFDNMFLRKRAGDGTSRESLAEGTYYWRVKTAGAAGETRKLTVVRDMPVSLLFPQDAAALSFVAEQASISLRWGGHAYAWDYEIQVSSSPDFKDISHRAETRDTRILVEGLADGAYYWRVIPRIRIKDFSYSGSSPVYRFSVARKKELDPPEIIYPPDGKTISKALMKKKEVLFQWRKSPEAARARVEIRPDAKVARKVYRVETGENFVALPADLPPGGYFFKVTAITADGKASASAPARRFTVTADSGLELLEPGEGQVVLLDERGTPGPVRFGWKSALAGYRYSVTLSRGADSKDAGAQKTVDTDWAELEAAPGEYRWKVSLLDEDGTPLVESAARSVFILPRMGPPRMQSPPGGSVINMRDRDSLRLEWKKLNGADRYRLTLYQMRGQRMNNILEEETRDTAYTMKRLRLLDEGEFLWTLQALDTDASGSRVLRRSPVARRSFTITLGKQLEKPKVVSPTVQYKR